MDFNSLVNTSIADTTGSLMPFAPELILCLTLMGLLLIRLLPFGEKLDAGFLAMLGVAGALYVGGPWSSLVEAPEKAVELFGGMIVYDSFTIGIRGILLAFTILFVIFTKFSGMPGKDDRTDFYCLILGAVIGMCLMVSANHMMMVFLAVEMASVPSYALAGIKRGDKAGSEAALKYSIYGAGAAGVMLYGISLLAGLVNAVHLPSIAIALSTTVPEMSRPELLVLILAALMIMVGLAFKLSAVPFHFWCPDIFEGATAEIGAFLSIASKAAALALLVRVCLGVGMMGPDRITASDLPTPAIMQEAEDTSDEPEVAVVPDADPNETVGLFAVADDVAHADEAHADEAHAAGAAHDDDSHAGEEAAASAEPLANVRLFIGVLIAVIASITCTFGNLAAYGQSNIKRLFAYSTIAHAGYMMMPIPAALAVATTHPDSARDAISSVVLYIAIYAFMNLGAFAVVAFLRNTMNTEEILDFSGLIRRSPVVVICFAMIMFSLVGLPPLAGFIGKFALFAALADAYSLTNQTHLIALLVVGGINTAISLFYYLRVVKVMTIDPESDAISTFNGNIIGALPLSFVVLMTLPVGLLIVNWTRLAAWGATAAQQLFG